MTPEPRLCCTPLAVSERVVIAEEVPEERVVGERRVRRRGRSESRRCWCTLRDRALGDAVRSGSRRPAGHAARCAAGGAAAWRRRRLRRGVSSAVRMRPVRTRPGDEPDVMKNERSDASHHRLAMAITDLDLARRRRRHFGQRDGQHAVRAGRRSPRSPSICRRTRSARERRRGRARPDGNGRRRRWP